ncbi:Cytidylate kinase (Cmk) (PDB:3R20) (PUBMED:19111750 [Commensalibacter communis]|uniref:Cytidylate kinase n=1 Tax=Commensalibacter communis TaxID=2972786 RepID=A0A9W4XI00_9PROT|nr:(d)CMP kinase [Commensalibacter communis]CAI3922266.1 Cytidylate kinase (Cmk) (PDB:3R20) (PUBMED:19111750 [Commensalibacter communis]CAI3943637.1 Cytidylate kinase (Cmk) (PDB:3R20) (PUBMED:19111750 [Commensalibacter communis]CAI3950900.1 Cytidylate kinase (Cmk) (PDB:3R20) (PUBMED:19111750 [Commensalibacter communis]CAI3952519.1 Cytidylate kinase (Cmk) (PDB:3R20) (PUBMED:19111750 [Commensalibacter communis]
MSKKLVIAIDGYSGVGKGTLAKALADKLSLPYLDTGLLYRAVGKKMLDAGLSVDSDGVVQIAEELTEKDWLRDDLRTPKIDKVASQVAAQPRVRAALLDMQRHFATQQGVVMDGRDIGTVIFPNADVKLFVTASAKVRAERRWLQYTTNPNDPAKAEQIKQIELELMQRDEADASRAVAPLRPAEDAHIIDTDHLNASEVLTQVLEIIQR